MVNGQVTILGSNVNPTDDYRYQMGVTADGAIPVSGAVLILSSGTNGALIHDFTTALIQRMDYEDKYQPIYMGLAIPGTATSAAEWQIRKNVTSGNPALVTAVLFGSGNSNFDKIWDNRSGTGEAYS